MRNIITGRIIRIASILSITALLSIPASAASLFQPYGYSLPLETLAYDPDSLGDQNYISGHNNGIRSYEDGAFIWQPRGSSMMCIVMGSTTYGIDGLKQAVSAGKINVKITFSLEKSDNPNKPANPVEYLDFFQSVKASANSNFADIGYKFYYDFGSFYAVDLRDSIGGTSTRVSNLYFGKFYTYISEIDVEAGRIYQCFKDYETGAVVGERTLNIKLDGVRNGARARFFPMWDMKMKEFSCYRETFAVTNKTIAAESDTVTASMDVALDCSKNAVYGDIDTNSPVLVLC